MTAPGTPAASPSGSPLGHAPDDPRLAASLENWQRKLLDLTKRNRALNFRATRVSTVTMVDEHPAAVFRTLYLDERAMRFKAAPEPASAPEEPSPAGEELEDDEAPTASDFVPYDPSSLDERHTDDWLQTAATPDALDRSLRRLEEQARLSVEEQGVATLFLALGMLHYAESADGTQELRAPLVLLPVELTRRSARSGYVLRAADDEPMVNPALAEHLRREHGLALPALPESGAMPDDYDLQQLLAAVQALVADRAGWSVRTDVHLALFSFQKLVMYKDLETNGEALRRHRLIRQLVTRSGDGDVIVGLPDEVRRLPLDEAFPPERTAQVVDADGSQLRAIAAVAREHDLVIEGPPGTGKSQTITNLIAQALAAGRSVLFVAEKMAALSVVHERLVRAGLGEFCLELHATRANKRAVMRELAAALDASLQAVDASAGAAQRLPQVRATLTGYARAVHEPHGALGLSPFRAYGELATVREAPRVRWEGALDVSRDAFDQAVRDLEDVAGAAAAVGAPAAHPWRDTTRTFYAEHDLEAVCDAAERLAAQLDDVRARAAAVQAGDPWPVPPAEGAALVARGRELQALAARVAQRLAPEALEQEHAGDIAHVERKTAGVLGFLAVLDGRYRAIGRRWTSYRKPGYAPSLAEQAAEMRQVDRLRAERQAFAALEPRGRALFGEAWRGEESDWDALARDVQRVEEARRTLALLRELVGWPADHLAVAPLADAATRVRELGANVRLAQPWTAFEAARQAAARSLGAPLLDLAMRGELPFDRLVPAFRRAFLLAWLTDVVRARPALERFHGLTHEQRVREFRELDQRVLLENRAALVGRLRERVQRSLREPEAAMQMPFLRREMARQRGLSPLRRTMQQAGAAVRAIKPCFMMSPLTVAQLVDGGLPSFDLVIFDEASQLPAEDAVGAIARGRQLVVVGDPKQLPPTDFFAVGSGAANAPLGDDGQPLYEDAESILEEYMGAGVPMSRLKWHYRSAHESLISFSNVQFYESDLHTFPSVEAESDALGLRFEHVPDGVYEGKGLNLVEARRVADAVVRFAREQLVRRDAGQPVESLGVGTFNLRQQLAILDELEQRRRDDPSIEPFFDRAAPEPFFVKNLENIQGDERDAIFISVTYAKGPDGRLRHHFGPLNGENGWRRLNVLTTRARRRMRVFASMRGDDIDATTTTARGAQLLREFLRYAEHGRLESASASGAADTESPFERDVYTELVSRGLRVVPQVGVAGYRVDLGVLDDARPGRFVCGIECDGVSYHASETARDRDRLRQQVLEARGWTIHRVWSTDWFKDRAGQVERLLSLVEESRARSREQATAEREARERAAAELARQAAEAAALQALSPAQPRPADERPYVRPAAAPYAIAPGEDRHAGTDLLDAPLGQLAHAVASVAEGEAPLHETDLLARVAGMWGTRLGSRIQARIRDALAAAEQAGTVRRRGPFVWSAAERCTVRSRAGTRIPAERIAPEEVEQAVLLVLQSGHGFARPQLVSEVRALFGYGRTGAALDEAVGAAVERLVASGQVGEGSTGVRLRG